MKTKLTFLGIALILGLALMLLSGCYTQVGALRGEREDRDEYTAATQEPDSLYENEAAGEEDSGSAACYGEYDDQWHRPAVGFNYYYPSYYWPSTAFYLGYSDPWYYDSYWGYPWICGTPYVYYGWRWYSPYYYSYWYPYWWDGHGSWHANRNTRDFGNTRGTGGRSPADTRTGLAPSDRGTTALPTGARVGRSADGSSVNRSAPAVKDNSRRTSSSRSYAPRTTGRSGDRSGTVRIGPTGRSGSARVEGSRRVQSQPRSPIYRSAPHSSSGAPRGSGARDHGVRSSGGSRMSTPSFSPPPARMPSSPAPSGGRGQSGGGGRRP